MSKEQSFVSQLVLQSFTEPRKVAEYLISLDIDRRSLWLLLGLVSILSALVLSAVAAVTPAPEGVQTVSLSPWMAAVFVGFVMLAMVFALHYIGRWLGGTGSLDSTILLISWHQGITVAFQLLQLVLVLISPLLGSFANFAGIVFLFYILLQFIDVLHGYKSLWKSFGAFALSIVAMVIALSLLLPILGLPIAGTV